MDLEVRKIKMAALNPAKPYIVSIEVGDMPKENVTEFCNNVKEKLEEMGFEQLLIVPCKDGVPSVKFTEVKDSTTVDLNFDFLKDVDVLSKDVKKEK